MPSDTARAPLSDCIEELPAEITNSQALRARAASRLLRKVFSFPAFIAAVLAAGAYAVTASDEAPMIAGKLFCEGDTWWHIAVGQRILSTSTWPTTDIYSFTIHGTPWISSEWLGEVVMAIAARLGGLHGLAVLLVALSITFVLLTYYYAWLRSRNPLASGVAAALVTPVAAACFTMRPQLLGYTFLLITLICLERFRLGRRRALWVLPLVFLLWANTHGSFVLGLFALGLYWASGLVSLRSGSLVAERWTPRQRRELLLISIACALALLVTPYGPRLALFPFEFMVKHPVIPGVFTEWQPLDLSQPFAKLFLALVVVTLVWQIVCPAVYRLETLVLLLFAIGESCLHARFLIVFAIVYAPVLATLFARTLPPYRPAEDRPILNAALVGALVWGMVGFFPSEAKLNRMLGRTFPVGAVEYMSQHDVPARMFNEDTWGSFLIWSLGAKHPVFIDGRAEVYENSGVLADYVRIITLQQGAAPDLLRKYGVTACLLHRTAPLGALLAASPDWKQAYGDNQAVIFVRAGQQAGAVKDGHLPRLKGPLPAS